MTEQYIDLLIRIYAKSENTGTIRIDAVLDGGIRFRDEMHLDERQLQVAELDPDQYGAALASTLFSGKILRAYDRAFGRPDAFRYESFFQFEY